MPSMPSKRIVKKFLMIVGGISGTYLLIASVVTFSIIAANNRVYSTQNLPAALTFAEEPEQEKSPVNLVHIGEVPELPGYERINVLILGADNTAGLTDTIIVASFDPSTGAVHMLNIPRDTLLIISQERMDNMRGRGLNPWTANVRINAMRSMGRQYGIFFLQEQLAEDLGIEFHHYIEVDLAAFRRLVDLVGGVEMEIPIRMVHDMRDQGAHEIRIDMQPGMHHLDGAMAEQVIRYRGYAAADIARISVQQQFMTQLFRQVLTRETVMNNPIELARIGLDYVTTDITITDAFSYLPYLEILSPDKIFTYTLPGAARSIQGGNFWVPDGERIPYVINTMFFDAQEEAEEETRASHGMDIVVLNGTQISGLAMSMADTLRTDGYTVLHADRYPGTQQNQTRILVREEGMGEDLLEYFNNANIRIDLNQEHDIVIIMGRSEQ